MKARIIPLSKYKKRVLVEVNDEAVERLPVSQCRKVLQGAGKQLNDEAILKIRDYFYHLAAIAWEAYQCGKQQPKNKAIPLEPNKTANNEERHYYEKSHYLRAG
ncbi:hypothetical protein [Chitinophaga eiseniae]|uniref:Uncharacterized protein n=1 Tax=Chitinophaga eiseniae TaxID=634771 RepID=A0A847SVR7_9BACT|nr:hypothetical protein [Chitinophaga eiseniae]NLR80952.1 hypothetical protein [Chitinophaga eiseniae]